MKVAVVYLRVVRNVSGLKSNVSYAQSEQRFLFTYRQFKPKIPHDLIVVDCGAQHQDTMFDSVAESYARYDGQGYDCGAYQHVGCKLDHDLILCLNTHVYFWRHDWLERFVAACDMHGPGVYGACGSFEEHPHIRTPAIAFCPGAIRAYPDVVDTRRKCNLFEFGPRNFTMYSMSIGYPVRIVAETGNYYLFNSNQIDNGFRHGDQSNVLIWDKHTEYWAALTTGHKLLYTNSARTLKNSFPDSRLDL